MDERNGYQFEWKDLGDIVAGRPNLGVTTHVAVYRLMQYTLRDVLTTRYGQDFVDEIFRQAAKGPAPSSARISWIRPSSLIDLLPACRSSSRPSALGFSGSKRPTWIH